MNIYIYTFVYNDKHEPNLNYFDQGPNKRAHQGLSQDLETGCLKLAIVNFLGVQILRGTTFTTIYSDFNHKHKYKFIKIRHNIHIQCHRNYMEMK